MSRPLAVDPNASPLGVHTPGGTDPLIAALARFVEALDRRYPDGPDQLRQEALDGRAMITRMSDRRKGTAA